LPVYFGFLAIILAEILAGILARISVIILAAHPA
jgi:hypothetical protein